MKEVIFVLVLGSVGVLFIVMGVLIRIGRYKRWYLVDDNSMFYHKAAYYGFIPWGLASMLAPMIIFLPTGAAEQGLVVYVVFSLLGIGVLLTFWQPWWLTPGWVRWLERNHNDILDILIEEGDQTPNWARHVNTQEQLEEWVAEVRRKHGL